VLQKLESHLQSRQKVFLSGSTFEQVRAERNFGFRRCGELDLVMICRLLTVRKHILWTDLPSWIVMTKANIVLCDLTAEICCPMVVTTHCRAVLEQSPMMKTETFTHMPLTRTYITDYVK